MPFVSSVEGKWGYGRTVPGLTYRYWRWQITKTKTMPPDSNCTAVSEFVFQLNGLDVQSITSTATVTNPGGSNPVGETPPNVVDNNLSTKALDLNFVTNGNITSFIFTFATPQTFSGYRWATANDFESRDPAAWTVSGSIDGINWVVVSTVINFTATSSRNMYIPTAWTLTV